MPSGIARRREAKAARRKKLLEDRRKLVQGEKPMRPMPDFGSGAPAGPDALDLGGENYNPAEAPDPKEWLALDEQERQTLVEDFHRRGGVRLPNETVHAIFHVIVENQIAEGDGLPVRRAVERLMNGGLDRHDALHAVASVLSGFMYDTLRGKKTEAFPQDAYDAAIERLTVESWRLQAPTFTP